MTTLDRALAKAKAAGQQQTLPPSGASPEGRVSQVVRPSEQIAGVRSDKRIEVDREALRRTGLLAPESQEWRLVEEYRQIKRPVLAKAAGRAGLPMPRANLVAVSSAVPGEGKTFTCINLALSVAHERDWRVLLVDGDVAKPNITGLFGLEAEPGLLDVLRSEYPIEKCVIATDIPGLSILPAGRGDDYTNELLASERMDRVMQYLADSDPRRLVLFDSSPLLATTQSAILASHMAQIVVVVKAESTTHEQVQHALARLDPEKAIGLVLNQAQLGARPLAYGGDYPYGYSSSQREASSEGSAPSNG